MPQSQTADQPMTQQGRGTKQRQTQHNYKKEASFFFLGQIIAKLERSQSKTPDKKEPTQNSLTKWEQQQTMNKPQQNLINM